jgi:hypothetical protein
MFLSVNYQKGKKTNLSLSVSVHTYREKGEAGKVPTSDDNLDKRTIEYGERWHLCCDRRCKVVKI